MKLFFYIFFFIIIIKVPGLTCGMTLKIDLSKFSFRETNHCSIHFGEVVSSGQFPERKIRLNSNIPTPLISVRGGRF